MRAELFIFLKGLIVCFSYGVPTISSMTELHDDFRLIAGGNQQ